MIPQLNPSGMLPPYWPQIDPTNSYGMAPYLASITEIAQLFGHTAERLEIMKGFLKYRRMLREAGIIEGFQWVDGSFVENCEALNGRSPRDIDVVTFAERPKAFSDTPRWEEFIKRNSVLFDPQGIKRSFKCEAYYEDLNLPGQAIVSRARYWFGLFSHKRGENTWKGLLQVPLHSDDDAALSPSMGTEADYAPKA